MKIVVTGSAGMVGSSAAQSLEQMGHQVVRIDVREPTPVCIGRDALDFEGVRAVVHCADPMANLNELAGHAGPVQMLTTVLEACRWAAVPRMVYTSSVWADPALYGIPCTDQHLFYGAAKLANEALLRAFARRHYPWHTAVALRLGAFDPGRPIHPFEQPLRLTPAGLAHWLERALGASEGYHLWTALGDAAHG